MIELLWLLAGKVVGKTPASHAMAKYGNDEARPIHIDICT